MSPVAVAPSLSFILFFFNIFSQHLNMLLIYLLFSNKLSYSPTSVQIIQSSFLKTYIFQNLMELADHIITIAQAYDKFLHELHLNNDRPELVLITAHVAKATFFRGRINIQKLQDYQQSILRCPLPQNITIEKNY